VSFGAKPGEFLVLTNRLGNFRRLYVSGKDGLKALTPERKMDVESFSIDDNRYRILVSWNDQGFSRLEAYDAKTFAPLALPKFPSGASVYPGGTTMNSRFTTIGVESGKAPRTSYVYDWETKKLTQWVIPSAPEVKISNFADQTLEFYTARDGTKIPMLVRRPEKCGAPCPVVVNFHGGPESQSRPGFSTWAQMFVDAGFIYIEPNVRGSDGYGKEWLHADDGRKRLQVITDIEDAALFIRKNWKANGKEPKVGVMGGSYGGYSTLYAMTKFAGAYDSGVANVGMSNLVTFLQNTAPYRRILRITEYGDPEKDRDALVELSPTTHLSRVKGPLLIIQGVSDPRVPAGEAVQMYEAMKSKGLNSQLILFGDEGHGSVKRENQVLQIGHTLAFFKRTLTDTPETTKTITK
jgi:dipeptidyl aminopeptidase/acylaminoacyl peptidase